MASAIERIIQSLQSRVGIVTVLALFEPLQYFFFSRIVYLFDWMLFQLFTFIRNDDFLRIL